MPIKWVDNLLSHHSLPGVTGGRQGVSREVSATGLAAIEIVRMLSQELGIRQSSAAQIASSALATHDRDEARVAIGGVVIAIPLAEVEARLRTRLLEAVESTPRISRGRPRTGRRAPP